MPVRILDINQPTRCRRATVIQGDIRDRATVDAACAGVGLVHHNVASCRWRATSTAFSP